MPAIIESEKYKIDANWDNIVYAHKLKSGHLSGNYFLLI